MLRTLFAIVSALFASMIVVTFSQLANARLFPPPPGVDAATVLRTLPTPAFVLLVGGWLVAAYAGGVVGTRVATRWRVAAGLVPGVAIAFATWQWAQATHPPAQLSGLIELLAVPMAWMGTRLGLRLTRPEPAVRGAAWRGHDR
jgi:hypothetical protein